MAAPTPTLFEELPVLGKGKYTVGQDKPAELVLADFVKYCLEQMAMKAPFWEHVEILAQCVDPATLESLWAVLQPQLKDVPKETPIEFQGGTLSRKKREERVEWQKEWLNSVNKALKVGTTQYDISSILQQKVSEALVPYKTADGSFAYTQSSFVQVHHAVNTVKRDYKTAYDATSAKSRFECVARAFAKKSPQVAGMFRATAAALEHDVEKAIIELGTDAYECSRRKAQLDAFSVTENPSHNNALSRKRGRNQDWDCWNFKKRKPPRNAHQGGDPKRFKRDDGKTRVQCYKCGKMGHKADQCWSGPQDGKESNKAGGEDDKPAQNGNKEPKDADESRQLGDEVRNSFSNRTWVNPNYNKKGKGGGKGYGKGGKSYKKGKGKGGKA